MKQTAKNKFSAFPKRQLRASDEEWAKFQTHRKKLGLSWAKFIKEINNKLK